MITRKSFRIVLFIVVIVGGLWGSSQGTAGKMLSPDANIYTLDPILGRPFNISTGSISETAPAVAYNSQDNEFLVVWENVRAVDNDIYAQRVSEQGKLLSWFYVATGEQPAVAYNPKNNTYLVVYSKHVGTDDDIYARRVDYTGPTHPEFPVAWYLDANEVNPAVDYNSHPGYDEFLVVWFHQEYLPNARAVYAQRVAGTAGVSDTINGRIDVADGNLFSTPPDVAYNLNMNEYLVVYTRADGDVDVYGRRITGNGIPLAETIIDASGNFQYYPKVAAYRLNTATPYLVVFVDYWNDTSGDIRGYLVNQQGQPDQLINIATTPGLSEYRPAIAHSEAWGGYIVTWSESVMGFSVIHGRRVDDSGETTPTFVISETSSYKRTQPDISVGNTAALAVWSDDGGSAGLQDILGRLLGYQQRLPLVIQR